MDNTILLSQTQPIYDRHDSINHCLLREMWNIPISENGKCKGINSDGKQPIYQCGSCKFCERRRIYYEH